jgi:hypothetical protein
MMRELDDDPMTAGAVAGASAPSRRRLVIH